MAAIYGTLQFFFLEFIQIYICFGWKKICNDDYPRKSPDTLNYFSIISIFSKHFQIISENVQFLEFFLENC